MCMWVGCLVGILTKPLGSSAWGFGVCLVNQLLFLPMYFQSMIHKSWTMHPPTKTTMILEPAWTLHITYPNRSHTGPSISGSQDLCGIHFLEGLRAKLAACRKKGLSQYAIKSPVVLPYIIPLYKPLLRDLDCSSYGDVQQSGFRI